MNDAQCATKRKIRAFVARHRDETKPNECSPIYKIHEMNIILMKRIDATRDEFYADIDSDTYTWKLLCVVTQRLYVFRLNFRIENDNIQSLIHTLASHRGDCRNLDLDIETSEYWISVPSLSLDAIRFIRYTQTELTVNSKPSLWFQCFRCVVFD